MLRRSLQRLSGVGFPKNLVKRELAAASYLLEEDVPPAVVALAWNQTEVTGEGEKLMRAIGHVEGTQSCLLLTAQILVPLFFLSVCMEILFGAIILTGAALFFRRRERIYEEAEQVISQYAKTGSGNICQRNIQGLFTNCLEALNSWPSLCRPEMRRNKKPGHF